MYGVPSASPAEASLTIALTTPNDDDGAVLVTITGPSVLGVEARPGLEADESQVTSNGSTTTIRTSSPSMVATTA